MSSDLLGDGGDGPDRARSATVAPKTGDVAAGLATATAAAIAAAGPLLPLRDVEQLELLRDDRGQLGAIEARRASRGVGRPKGAKNKQTQSWADYLTSRYAHPLEVLAQLISRPIDAIVAETGCKPIEALTLVKSAAAELAPYVAGKMPVTVTADINHHLGLLVIEGVTHSTEEMQDIVQGEFMDVDEAEAEMAEFSHSEGDE